jgi:hypothetical protein
MVSCGRNCWFYFLAGLVFGVMAYLTNSILPGIVVHIGDATFFTMVWPYEGIRPWDGWFWVHITQAIVFAGLALLAFRRLQQESVQHSMRSSPETPASRP